MKQVTNFQLLTLLLVCCTSLLSAQTTWTGTNSSDWSDSGNWSAGIPDANDDVTIPNVSNAPIIMGGTSALAKSVAVQPNASLTINTNGSLTINGSASHAMGIYANVSALFNEGTVTNNGDIIIGSTNNVGEYGIYNLSTFDNQDGEIKIDRSNIAAIVNQITSNFTNSATITIGANAAVGDYGILSYALFNNLSGEIKIDRSNDIGLASFGGPFTNSADITIGANAAVGDYGIFNNTIFDNQAGEIKIDRSNKAAIFNQISGIFTNIATITIGANAPVGGHGIQNTALFNNNSGGVINIDNTGGSGIYNPSGTFTNHATINIGQNGGMGNIIADGILNNSVFNNNGILNISNTKLDAIWNIATGIFLNDGIINMDNADRVGLANGGEFTNNSFINIGQNGGAGNMKTDGIRTSSVFNNNGTITIDNIVVQAIRLDVGGNFTTTGTINIGQNGGAGNIINGIYSGNLGAATFTNNNGILNISNTKLDAIVNLVGATFNNNGDIHLDNTGRFGILNIGEFTNSDLINIGQNGGIGNIKVDGIRTNSVFNNDGIITIDNVGEQAIKLEVGGNFTTTGTINIGQNGGAGNIKNNGIFNGFFGATTFTNNNGLLNISNTGLDGIYNFTTSIFINNGVINLDNIGRNGIVNHNNFDNSTCAIINVFAPIFNTSLFTNAGLITVNTTKAHFNNGTFTNNGVLEIIQLPEVPNVINNDLIVAPIGGECEIMPALQIGGMNDFTPTSEWFTDPALTNKAGDYVVNTFSVTNLNEGVHTLYFTASGNGCTFPLSIQVNYDDVTKPIPVCKTKTLQLDANGNGGIADSDVYDAAASTDNCGTVNLVSFIKSTFTCADLGANTVTVTVNDGLGNTATCFATVNVVDNLAPNPVCKNSTVQLDASGNYTFLENDVLDAGSSTDNCGAVNFLSANPTSVSCAEAGSTIQVSVSTDDGHGNAANCTANITVEDKTPPVPVCKTTTVTLDNNGNYALTQNDVFDGGTDNCGIINFDQMTPTAVSCADAGKVVSVLVDISDAYGNKASCNANVTVVDSEAPVATCPANIADVVLDANGNGTLPANIGDGSSTDNCTAIETSPMLNFNCIDVGVHMVELTVTDGTNTVTTTCSFNVVDNTLPTPTCLNPTVQLDATGNHTLTQNDVYGGGTDNCTTVNFWKMTPTAVDCSQAGATVPVLVEVFDASGNQASCTANVTVEDAEAPVATCPANIPEVVLDGNGNGSLPANIGDGSSTDNCSAMETSPAINFNCSAGPQMVTLTVTDGFNTVTTNCSFDVVDNQAPVAHCPVNIPDVQLDANGSGTLPANIGDGSSTDNCSVVETSPAMNFTCGDVGIQTVMLTASDGTNSSTINCSFNVVDKVLPTANCVSQTIQATLNANAQYTIDPNQLNENSTDACGILSFAASPAVLDCQHEGTNTVTLTVTDSHGNIATCNATIEVADFLTLNPPTATAESCVGSGDGTISMTATAGGGQVKYSIDSGATFQPSGTFGNLSPGTYTIVVKVFGVPAVCEKTATATVTAGGSPATWFKDSDGDGYTDGTTQTSCAQPTGYISNPLPGTDCNDYDPLVFPGQTWYEDLDGDGYGSGSWSTACQRPAGCFTASELLAVDTDCNDLEAAVNPAATEICDGLDNDCDGETDEGLSGTYVGNVIFSTQAQLDAWLACYDVIHGSVTIQGGNITDLTPLSNIVEITGNLMVMMNATLTSLDGLENLADVGGAFYLYYNFQLSDCCAILGLLNNGGVVGPTLIFYNNTGCNSQAEIIGTCNPAPLVANGIGFTQSCSGCNSPRLLQVFPNPASHETNIHFSRHAPQATLQIADMLGRIVFSKKLAEGADRTMVDLSDGQFENGIYQVSLFENGETTTKQLVILR